MNDPLQGRKITRRANQAVSHVTTRMARHPIALGLIVAAFGFFLAYIAWSSVNGPPFQNRYKLDAIISSDAPILKPGGQVRVAGKLAGTILKVDPAGDGQDAVRISMELRPEYGPVGRDATARVRVRSIVYLTYVEIAPGNKEEDPLPDGSTLPLAQTSSGVDLLEVVQLFDEKTRDSLRQGLVNTGYGVAGRGEGLNEAFGDLDQTLELGTPQLRALTAEPGALAGTLSGAAVTTNALQGSQPDDFGALITSGDAALGAIARRSTELGNSLELLRPFEDELLETAPKLNPLLKDAAPLTEELVRPTRQLVRGLPQVNRLLGLGKPLNEETARIARLANPAIRLTGPAIYNLYPAVVSLDPILTSLQTMVAGLEPYQQEITNAGLWTESATSVAYPEGQTSPGSKALRFIPVMGCHRGRDPYPAPGEALEDSQFC